MNGGSPGRAGRWAWREGRSPDRKAQRPELNYKDNSFNLFLPLRVYFYECSKVNPSQGFCNGYDFLAEDSKFAYKYESLCRKHNDLSYNQKISVINGYDFTAQTFISEDFDSIKVTSDKDYDEKHPAGESLNDLCRFVAFSPYKFISSGYKDYYNYSKDNVSKTLAKFTRYWRISEGQKLTCHPIDKMLSDVTAEDLILLGYDNPYPLFWLHFERKPIVLGEHLVTVEVRTDEGKIYTATITMNFVADN